jgi:hypothetical protein
MNYGPKTVTSGLLLAVDAANKRSYPGTGTSWFDLSGNGITGTLTNGPTFNADNMGSIVFDGTNDYVVASNSLLVHRTSNWTYSCWLNFTSIPAYATIFSNGTWGSCLLFRYESGGVAIYSMSQTWGNFTFSPSLARWYKLDFIRNGNSVYFYVNGIYSQTNSFTADIQPNSNFYIGAHGTIEVFNGKISQVSIYNRALSASEVLQNYNSTKSRYNL